MATATSPELDESELALLKLSRRIDIFYIHQLKVVLLGLNITKTRTSQKSALSDLFGCVKEKIPDKKEALTFLCQVLEILGWNDLNDLKPYVLSAANYDLRTRYGKVDFILTVLQFLNSLEENDFEVMKTYVSSQCSLVVNWINDRGTLAAVIFDEVNKMNMDDTMIYRSAFYFNCGSPFEEYFMRHNFPLPGLYIYTHS